MKKILFLTLMMLFVSTLAAQQQSLYDCDGEVRAYIDYNEEATIFMWDGTPVAFVEIDGSDSCVFGFNGRFLGWYEDGVIYDKKGYAVGARYAAVSMTSKVERIKGIQKATPIRPVTSISPIQPILKRTWSNTPLTEFLHSGKK